jgi:hypothetical protein
VGPNRNDRESDGKATFGGDGLDEAGRLFLRPGDEHADPGERFVSHLRD